MLQLGRKKWIYWVKYTSKPCSTALKLVFQPEVDVKYKRLVTYFIFIKSNLWFEHGFKVKLQKFINSIVETDTHTQPEISSGI